MSVMASPDNHKESTDQFNISTVCKLLGLSRRQLYYWEHIGIVKPHYQPFGIYSYRCYLKSDLEKLARIKDYLNQGYTLKAAAQLVSERVQMTESA